MLISTQLSDCFCWIWQCCCE